MRVFALGSLILLAAFSPTAYGTNGFETDTIATAQGDLSITCIGHGTLMFQYQGKVVHVDPVSRYADYSKMPKADLILVTHEHGDHLDKKAIDQVSKPDTKLVLTETCAKQIGKGSVMNNGDVKTLEGIKIEAVPAYNIVHTRGPGKPFHPRGVGNGYVLSFADQRVYVAGDTEDVPEMAQLKDIDIAFLPMNLPYTMTPEMVAHAVRLCQPKIVYPYHFGDTDTSKLVKLLEDMKGVEVRLRKLQ